MHAKSEPHTATPFVYSLDELPSLTGLGRTRLYELINAGHLPARKVGRRTLVLREDVETFLRNLPRFGE